MSGVTIKRLCLTWGATLFSLVIVMIVGLVLAVGIGNNPQTLQKEVLQLPWGGWRALLYISLLMAWPYVIEFVLRWCRYPATKFSLPKNRSRRPLLVLILCYESFVVHNPLALLLAWWR